MRERTHAHTLERFMRALGAAARQEGRVYFTGGACAVLLGWRATTIDADVLLIPDPDDLLRAIPRLKEELRMNVELASPADFIPELPGWAERSPFIRREGHLSFHHYDFYAQALAKIERGHTQDLADVHEMFTRGLVEPSRLLALFSDIEGRLHRYPAVDPPSFRRAVEAAVARR